jgi:hypothetical protein
MPFPLSNGHYTPDRDLWPRQQPHLSPSEETRCPLRYLWLASFSLGQAEHATALGGALGGELH